MPPEVPSPWSKASPARASARTTPACHATRMPPPARISAAWRARRRPGAATVTSRTLPERLAPPQRPDHQGADGVEEGDDDGERSRRRR